MPAPDNDEDVAAILGYKPASFTLRCADLSVADCDAARPDEKGCVEAIMMLGSGGMTDAYGKRVRVDIPPAFAWAVTKIFLTRPLDFDPVQKVEAVLAKARGK